jgi:tetratricopeptide (TPR) repeat protein
MAPDALLTEARTAAETAGVFEDHSSRDDFLERLAETQARVGSVASAIKTLADMRKKDIASRRVAGALAESKDSKAAMRVAGDITTAGDKAQAFADVACRLHEMKQSEPAKLAIEKAIDAAKANDNPFDQAMAWAAIVTTRAKMDDLRGAQESLDNLTQLLSKGDLRRRDDATAWRTAALRSIAVAHAERGNYEQAIATIASMADNYGIQKAMALAKLAEVASRQRRLKDARSFTDAVKTTGWTSETTRALCAIATEQLRQGDKEGAAATFEEAGKVAREDPTRRAEALAIYHSALARSGSKDEMRRTASALATSATLDNTAKAFYVDALVEIGKALARQGHMADAEEVLDQALAATDSMDVIILRGQIGARESALAWARSRNGRVKAYALLGVAQGFSEAKRSSR